MKANWTAKDIPSQAGKRAIVTGANAGLGFQTARELARAGADVVLAVRSVSRGQEAARRIEAEQPGASVVVRELDTSSLASVRAFAEGEAALGRPIDILVNNAGIMMVPRREQSSDGFELQLATNYLGHFALTGLLLPLLLQAAAPRVVSVSSNAHRRAGLHLDDFQQERGYNPYRSYAQTKLAMLVFARVLQSKSMEHGGRLVSIGAHPGLSQTAIGRRVAGPPRYAIGALLRLLGQDDARGALPQLYAAAAPDAEPGEYYGPSGFQEFKGAPARAAVAPAAADAAAGERLWALSEQTAAVVYHWSAQA